jgi:hypothetical protein
MKNSFISSSSIPAAAVAVELLLAALESTDEAKLSSSL